MPIPGDSELATVIVGTAGHIDHGKSTLVRALTGVDPDRLPAEKSTQMTIDLGFAPLVLPDGRTAGVIDVPGHERFIKNMVAGATSLDVALLVVDANEGVMPQTREHVEILELLGVERGLVALTKVDVAGEELAELAAELVREALAGSFLADAPLVPVSALTGDGLDDLVREVARAVKRKVKRRPGPFRMPIQRVFSARGHGTIVTGVPISGSVRIGDAVEIGPPAIRGRVRAIQAYGRDAELARAGHSSALNLADVDYKAVHRGMVAHAPGAFEGQTLIEATLHHLESAPRPLRHLTEVRFHVGTAEVLGKLAVLDGREIAPGVRAPVQVRLAGPVVCAPGDRFILRRAAEHRTIGGGEVLGASEHRLKSGKAFVVEALKRKEEAVRDPGALLEEALRLGGAKPASPDRLAVQTGLGAAEVAERLEALAKEERAVRLRHGSLWVHREGLDRARRAVLDAVEALYEEEPLRVHVERLQVRERSRLEPDVFEEALGGLARARRIERLDAKRLKRVGRSVELTPEQERQREAIVEAFGKAPLAPPSAQDLAKDLAPRGGLKAVNLLLNVLSEEGVLVHTGSGLFFSKSDLEKARSVLYDVATPGEVFTPAAYREALGTSRRYVIPILEYFDKEGLTAREGGARRLVAEREEAGEPQA